MGYSVILFLYQVIILLVLMPTIPILVLRGVFPIKGLSERFGNYEKAPDVPTRVWFHAASVGELKVAASLIPLLNESIGNLYPIVSVMTRTGKQKALSSQLKARVYYSPLELYFAINRAIRKTRPRLLVLAETELWPLFIWLMKRHGVIVVIANARISHRSWPYYRKFAFLFGPALRQIDLIMAQTEVDRQRFIAIGASPGRVSVYGNIKFDQLAGLKERQPAAEILNFIKSPNAFVFIAGSVRKGEMPIIVKAITLSIKANVLIRAIIAPRHMKDLPALKKELKKSGAIYVKRSRIRPNMVISERILLLDTMGELDSIYRYCNLAFVGGSLVSIGGHDPLEPASAGCALCFGSSMYNNQYAANKLIELGAACQVNGADELANLIVELADNPEQAARMGKAAAKFVNDNAGVSKKIASALSKYLE